MIAAWWFSAAHAACTAVIGATVHGPTGPLADHSVVFDGARIVAVAAAPPELVVARDAQGGITSATWKGAACAAVAGKGRELSAGIVTVQSQFGLVEVGLERSSRDDDPETPDPIRAALIATDAYDPNSTLVDVARLHGITSAVTNPSGGFVSGQAGYVRLWGVTQAESVIAPSVAMIAGMPTASTADAIRTWRELISDVRTHARAPGLYDGGRPYLDGASRLDLEALRPVADGRLKVVVPVESASDIEALIRLEAELGLDLVIDGGAEAWMLAPALAKSKIPVVVDPLVYGPGGFDQRHARPDNAALLAAAGVDVMLSVGRHETHNARTLRQAAGNAVREGMPHAAAMAALTSTPARVFGQPDRGRVATGAIADLVLWTGDPLELSTSVARMWIDGVEVTLRSRQTELFERYRTLPGTPLAPLSLPAK